MYEVTAEKNVARDAGWRNTKALAYSTLVAASVNNACVQIVVSGVLLLLVAKSGVRSASRNAIWVAGLVADGARCALFSRSRVADVPWPSRRLHEQFTCPLPLIGSSRPT